MKHNKVIHKELYFVSHFKITYLINCDCSYLSKFTDRIGGNVYEKYKECEVRYIGVSTLKCDTSYLSHRIYLSSLVRHSRSFPFSYKIWKVHKEMFFISIRFTKPKPS